MTYFGIPEIIHVNKAEYQACILEVVEDNL